MNEEDYIKNAALKIFMSILEHPEIASTSHCEIRCQNGAREAVADYSVKLAQELYKAINKRLNNV